ncbi:LysR family transcriptional regulator [Achromobacter xylosoxidans]|uniref:LysR family transcriptional regulator n=1 Tax=Alcaligenes xylosoxydans xylosoxydans TaxID=85698 RepID=UPI001231A9BB|nr:LysR family transcriptional regulator [Achromobacter xylosoxidans]KAA5923064.1 LysR family transcriptional regulator [Achromobacter xylosoxidans]MEC6409588.1 LysR substrate-binding domain-containing protein [Achromobacter xylosoxidans]
MISPLGPEVPTLRQLELLLSLASADGIASAGAKIGMTPSATSHALRALESTLGVLLIDRNAPQLELTHAGEQILPHVRDVFAALQLIQATANASVGLKSGMLKIGSFGLSSSLRLLPPLLQQFRKLYPGIDLRVFEKADADIVQDLIERRLEIGVVTLPKPQFDTVTIANDELVAVVPARHELASLDTIEVGRLAQFPFILTHAGSQELVARMFSRADVSLKVTHELSQMLSILDFVARGEGISVVASLALPARYDGVVYKAIAPLTSRRVGLACLNESRLSPAAAAFWKLAKSRSRKKHAPTA